ncbi:MAG: GrdX family protein [Fretibacterium sp.]|nr:GrdX family protein [Fretibacterium sp.]
MMKTILITNNEELCCCVQRGRFIDGSSLDVLIAVRDLVHRGGVLLTHPLCGNLRPYQQPFRSILIEEHPGGLVDLDSLSLIEEAVSVYNACRDRLIFPDSLQEETRADYAYIDGELMRESLEQYGQLRREAVLHPASLKKLH